MSPKRRKCITYTTMGFYFFFSGVEYAVILPTAWLYLDDRFHAQPYMLGVLLSAFCLSSMIAGPIMGRWSDRMQKTKVVILFANLWQVAGSLMYWFGYGPWCLVAGRFIAGIGTGMGPVLIADIARVTTTEERTSTLSIFMAVKQLGLLIGPACNLFLRKLDFKIGPYAVDKFTSPGLFMAVLWIIFEVLILICYSELPEIQRQIQSDYLKAQVDDSYHSGNVSGILDATTPTSALPDSEEIPSMDAFSSASDDTLASPNKSPVRKPRSPRMMSPPINAALNQSNLEVLLTSSNEMIESAERFMSTPEEQSEGSPADGLYFENSHFGAPASRYRTLNESYQTNGGRFNDSYNQQYTMAARTHVQDFGSSVNTETNPLAPARSFCEEYMREEIVVMLAAVFISFFVQIALETLLTPLANILMDWDELQISYLYTGISVEVLITFIILNQISKRVKDRTLILFGYLCEVITLSVLMWYLPTAPPHNESYNLPYLLVTLFFNVLGLPFLMVCSNSLYSKLTRKETQGFSQGIRRFSGGLGNLLAPLWAGSLVNNLSVLVGVLLAMITLATLMLILSFKKLKPREEDQNNVVRHPGSINNSSERTPLLSARS